MSRRLPPKIIGERAECAFVWHAMEHDFFVSKPYGDSAPYDFIVQRRPLGPLQRIQVKAAGRLHFGCYYATTGHYLRARRQQYSASEIDFFAVWVPALLLWYIVPVKAAIATAITISACGRPSNKYEKYREAWHLLG